jgi:hypothetical protein
MVILKIQAEIMSIFLRNEFDYSQDAVGRILSEHGISEITAKLQLSRNVRDIGAFCILRR